MIGMPKVRIILGTKAMRNLNIGMGIDLDTVMDLSMVMKIRIGDKEMVMEKRYGTEDKKRPGKVYRASGTQGHTHYTNHRNRESVKFTPSRGIGGGHRGDDGNGGDKGNGDRKKYRNTNYDLAHEDEEESDTEESFELEITPQQLSQVTPGGGVLKLNLSKKKPLKITTKAPSGEPVPSQTTVKTVYHLKKEKGYQTERGTIDIAQTGLEHFRREEAPPIGGREPPQEDENGKFNRRPGGQGGLDDKGSKRNGNGGPGGSGDPNGGGGPGENGEPPRRGGGEPPRRNEELGGGDGGSDPSDDDGGGDGSSSPSSDTIPPRRRRHRRPRFVYVVQGPPGPPGQMGQPGQAGRDGRDGQAPQLTKALEEALRAQVGNLDTTGLENSFDYFGKTMTEVLNAQQRANRNLEEQFRKANETQESQVEAMQDMAQVNYQMKFDHMFSSVPIYDGTDPDSFDDWLYQIESLCELSQRDVRIKLMGRASAHVKHLIRSLPLDTDWETARRELKRCLRGKIKSTLCIQISPDKTKT